MLYTKTVNVAHKRKHGQFFTPIEIARFMGGLSIHTRTKLKLLDPGCGTLILSCTVLENLLGTSRSLQEIDLVAYETDTALFPFTRMVLDYLKRWLKKKNVKLNARLLTTDFVLDNRICFSQNEQGLFDEDSERYDIVISNPPYFKISGHDTRALLASSVVYGQPNIYSIFLIVSAKLLKNNGQLIFITPRSFSSGNYFRAFRQVLFQEVQIESIHLFGSRRQTFTRDKVLQETLIIKAKRKASRNHDYTIRVTHSRDATDLERATQATYRSSELIDFSSSEKILHLPADEIDHSVIKLFKSWPGSLNKYNIQISTGPVVSFRARKYLSEKPQHGHSRFVPLYQLQNTAKMSLEWPVTKKGKPQFITLREETRSILLPNKNYIFLRRFSAKDDKSRLVASPYFADIAKGECIGVENHLNYIYRPNGHLGRDEILGLAALLNSNIFDRYFRTFNGNINVSATELREMPLPPLSIIKAIGNEFILQNDFSELRVNEIVNEHFKLNKLITSNEQD